jgi:hypothetical protein
LVVDEEDVARRPLTVALSAHTEALAVFSFEEEAQMYLRLRPGGVEEWRAQRTSAGELISVLCEPCTQAKWVVLDPIPEPGGELLAGLLSMNRADFLQTLVRKDPSLARPALPRSESSLDPVTGVA